MTDLRFLVAFVFALLVIDSTNRPWLLSPGFEEVNMPVEDIVGRQERFAKLVFVRCMIVLQGSEVSNV